MFTFQHKMTCYHGRVVVLAYYKYRDDRRLMCGGAWHPGTGTIRVRSGFADTPGIIDTHVLDTFRSL